MKIIDLRSVTQWNKWNEKRQALQQTEKLTSENLKDPSDKHRTLETTCGRENDYLFNLSFFREKNRCIYSLRHSGSLLGN